VSDILNNIPANTILGSSCNIHEWIPDKPAKIVRSNLQHSNNSNSCLVEHLSMLSQDQSN